MPIPLSVLDLAPVAANSSAAAAVRRTVELAQLAEQLGYVRYWFAEHHSMPAVASSAPEILIGHVASATQRIRVGAGGIMLPNHAPLRIAEAFHTLAALHPERIDLGLGRAPGADHQASRALRAVEGERFPALLAELLAFSQRGFPQDHPLRSVQVSPDDAPLPPVWILGASGASAQLAGAAGMGYGFAAHFSSTPPAPAMRAYRQRFTPSAAFAQPHAILVLAVVCAETDAQAQYLAATMELARLRINRGEFLPLPSPDEALAYPYTDAERAAVRQFRMLTLVGQPQALREHIETIAREVGADEVMVVTNVYSQIARLRSYELLAQAFAA